MIAPLRRVSMVLALVCLTAVATAGGPPSLERALELAGPNRPQLERVLEHYRAEGDAQKLAAAEFLIANMEGHGYAVHAFFDAAGNEVAFDALAHATGQEAHDAFEALENTHGPLHAALKRFEPDLETITADLLIENIDLAFREWRRRPWASDISFEVFCEHILPYRGSHEPLERWRPVCLERLGDVQGDLRDMDDLVSATGLVHRRARDWVRLSDIYDLHPTDQGFAQMLASGRGRSEDMSNMMVYAFRSCALVAAQDFAPFWTDRGRSHAWTAMLDAQGRGGARLGQRAAKVYRRTYSTQDDSLGAIRHESEKVPEWLASRHQRDVTSEYMETTDVTVTLTVAPPAAARCAFICIFNDGQWHPVHWARIEGSRATFTEMGRSFAYMPAYGAGDGLVPAGPPLILSAMGKVEVLGGGGEPLTVTAGPRPGQAGDGQPTAAPMVPVKPGHRYELFVWEDGWQSRGAQMIESEPVVFEGVPANRLYRLVAEDAPRLARLFTVQAGRCTSW